MTDETTNDFSLQPLAASAPAPEPAVPQPDTPQPGESNSALSEEGTSDPQAGFAVSDTPALAAAAASAANSPSSPSTTPSPTPAPTGSPPEWLPEGRPELEQTLRNIRVWLPFLANPNDRLLQVRFSPDDDRVGLNWKVALPRLCWHCGMTEGMSSRTYEDTLRSFEYPVPVVAGTVASALLALLIAWMSPFFGIVLFLMVLVIGAAVLWLKSWKEEVRMTFWTCSEHAGPMKAPGLVIDDQQLHVTLGNAKLVAAANEDIRERRRTGAGRKALGSTGSASPGPAAPTYREPPISESSRREISQPLRPPPRPTTPKPELPPIRLAGDDE